MKEADSWIEEHEKLMAILERAIEEWLLAQARREGHGDILDKFGVGPSKTG